MLQTGRDIWVGLVFAVTLAPLLSAQGQRQQSEAPVLPVPEKLVVLTFDDSAKSHFSVVRPILLEHGFGATFFITEGFDFRTNKRDYMTWEQIAQLHQDGFEIGNHTADHLAITEASVAQLHAQLSGIEKKCEQYGIPRPQSFAWPGNKFTDQAFAVLAQHGIRFARRGGEPEYDYQAGQGFAYEPGLDHPLLIPSAGDARPGWELADLITAVEQAQEGRIAVLQFHGVPDSAHPWVNTDEQKFVAFMRYLKQHNYQVIALRGLQKYVHANSAPKNWRGVIDDRRTSLENEQSRSNVRPLAEAEERRWLENMVVFHRYSADEVAAATGMTAEEAADAVMRWRLTDLPFPARRADEPLLVKPYPGGRHPRIGFRDGMIRPQRETKVSVFPPWSQGDYVVVDLPEAIWFETDEHNRRLLYLAHTHIPTHWDLQKQKLPQLEWTVENSGTLSYERTLPNGVQFAASVQATRHEVRMRLKLTNGSSNELRGLRVQNCVLLREATGFAKQNNDNKTLRSPYAACSNEAGDRWIITAWTHAERAWANAPCPCLHVDPRFPDCPPGESRELVGRLWFYEGTDLPAKLQELERSGWQNQ